MLAMLVQRSGLLHVLVGNKLACCKTVETGFARISKTKLGTPVL